ARRAQIPATCCGALRRRSPTLFAAAPEHVHCLGIATTGRTREQRKRFDKFSRHAVLAQHETREVELRPRESELGSGAIAPRGDRQIDWRTPAQLMTAPDHIDGVAIAGACRELKPTECCVEIALGAMAIEKHQGP